MIDTPSISLPISRIPESDTFPSWDGKRQVDARSAAAAFEAILYATSGLIQASATLDRLIVVREREAEASGRARGALETYGRALKTWHLECVARAAGALRIAADLYEAHGLGVEDMPAQLRKHGVGWSHAEWRDHDLDTGGVRIERWTFSRPREWVDFAEHLEAGVDAAADELREQAPPRSERNAGVVQVAPIVVYVTVSLIAAAIVATLAYASINRVLALFNWQQRVTDSRLECGDEAMERYELTGDPRALERARMCYEQADDWRQGTIVGPLVATGLTLGITYLLTRR